MNESADVKRTSLTTRINVRPQALDALRSIAKSDCISLATMIGMAIEAIITVRSTA